MKKFLTVICLSVCLILFTNLHLFAAEKTNTPLWCTPPVTLGMSQDEVLNTWGEPDVKESVGQDDLGIPRERWVYKTHPPLEIFSGHSYVCTTFNLTFTGKNLTDYKAGGDDTK